MQVGPPAVVKWQDRFVPVRTQDLRRVLIGMAFVAEDWGRSVLYLTNQKYGRRLQAAPDQPIRQLRVFAEALVSRVLRGSIVTDGGNQGRRSIS